MMIPLYAISSVARIGIGIQKLVKSQECLIGERGTGEAIPTRWSFQFEIAAGVGSSIQQHYLLVSGVVLLDRLAICRRILTRSSRPSKESLDLVDLHLPSDRSIKYVEGCTRESVIRPDAKHAA